MTIIELKKKIKGFFNRQKNLDTLSIDVIDKTTVFKRVFIVPSHDYCDIWDYRATKNVDTDIQYKSNSVYTVSISIT